MIYLDYPSGKTDPFWASVLFYLPMTGSGDVFEDVGPLSADNVITVVGTPTANVFEQNSGVTLFDLPTLHMQQPGAGLGDSVNIFLENSTKVLGEEDYCIEWWFRQSSWAAASVPVHAWFTTLLGTGGPLLAGRSTPIRAMTFRGGNNGPGETFDSGSYDADVWRHVAIQYVEADALAYVYIDKAQVGTYIASMTGNPGFRLFVGDSTATSPSGPASFGYDIRIAHLRGTAANRYGDNPTIDVADEPFPTS